MADEKSPEQLQQEMFDSAQVQLTEPQDPMPAEPTPVPEPTPTPAPEPAPPAEPGVPSWRLREEAEGRRLAEDRARALEARLNEISTHMRQQEKQPDFFEDPNRATQELLVKTLTPFAEETRQQLMYNSQLIAGVVHGVDKVTEAEKAFLEARAAGTLDPADYERVVQSPNRYDAAVQWHKRQSAWTAVEGDPEAWYQKRREAEMNDPKFQAEVMARARGGAASRPSETRLPPSLSKSTAVASNAGEPIGDMSDQSLFRYAMTPPTRGRPQ